MENAIELKNVSKNYKGFSLKNVTFNVPTGSIMGFIGENGAGKTTVLKSILNLIKLDSGQISILGVDSKNINSLLKENIGVAFDESYFCDNLCVKDVGIIMRHVYKNWNKSIYENYIKKFGLPEKKIFKDYSKGMKMKLAIAVALSHNAKLLILDEATSGLDPIVRDEILDIFLEFIQNDQNTVFISSHIISDLEKISDYITFIHEGRVLFSKNKDDLIYNYGIVKCTKEQYVNINKKYIVGTRKSDFGCEVMVNDKHAVKKEYPEFTIDESNIEEIMLYNIRYKED